MVSSTYESVQTGTNEEAAITMLANVNSRFDLG